MKVIIFDMDGTVLDSSEAIARTINEARFELGFKPLSTVEIICAVNTPGRDLVKEFYGIDNPSAKFKDLFEDKFKKNYDLLARPYDGIVELLQNIKLSGSKIAMASNAPANTLEDILKKCEIYDFFDVIVGACKDMRQKPEPDMLYEAIRLSGASSGIFVGDSLKDEQAAKAASIPYIQVCWGLAEHSIGADFNADNTKEAWDLIHNML